MHRSWVAAVAIVLVVAGAGPAGAVPPTSTSLLLSTATSAYGQGVTATATVTATPGPAQGDVVFSIDDLTISANLGANGATTVVLPDATVGQHAVSATFVPQLPADQEGSTSPTQTWVVTQVRTRLQVRVIGKGLRIPTSVRVSAAGEYGTRPTGRVRVVVIRRGTRDAVRVVERLDSTGVALADVGRLRKGRYRLVVTYSGDSQHLGERRFGRFRVVQR